MSDIDSTPSNPNAKLSLNVLPSSGKVDQLKREVMQEREAASELPNVPAETVATFDSAPELGSEESLRRKLIEGKVIGVLRTIYDPEIPIDIYELGLIYDVTANADNSVVIQMTLTAPGCPVAGSLPGEVETKVESIPEVKSATVNLVWEPAWDKSRMSEAALLQLGM